MKATVVVRLKTEVLDPQGDAVRRALSTMGFTGIKGVRVGKIIEIEIDDAAVGESGEAVNAASAAHCGRHRRTAKNAKGVKAALAEKLRTMADELLANPVIEDYEVRLGE